MSSQLITLVSALIIGSVSVYADALECSSFKQRINSGEFVDGKALKDYILECGVDSLPEMASASISAMESILEAERKKRGLAPIKGSQELD